MSQRWLKSCRARGWTKRKPFPAEPLASGAANFPAEKYEELKQRLLAVAGQAVCFHYEEDLLDILRRGQFFRGYDAISRRGEPCQCHSNSAALWQANQGLTKIATGYALSRDGMWRQHSWCVMWNQKTDAYQVIETTEPRLLYYGYVMNSAECEKFLSDNP